MGKGFALSAFFTLIYSKVNELFLATIFGFSELAVFNVALTLGFAWTFIPQALGLSYFTKALKFENEAEKRNMFSIVCLIMFIVSLKKVIFCALFSIAVGYYLVSEFGVKGASYALLLTEFVSLTVANYFFLSGIIFKIHMGVFNITYRSK
jgi:O-antigen/teichoic acid export membrane protein